MSSETHRSSTNRWLAGAVIFLAVVVLVLLGMVFHLANKKPAKPEPLLSITAPQSIHHQRMRQQPRQLQAQQYQLTNNNGMPHTDQQFIRLQRQMNQEMAAMQRRMHHMWQHQQQIQPAMHMQQSGLRLMDKPKEYIAYLRMQGVNKNNVKVNLKNQLLSVSANINEKHSMNNQQQKDYQQFQSQMSQSVYLPEKVDAAKMQTKFKKDRVIITIPKLK